MNVTPTNDDADADTANDDNLANLIAQIDAVINTIVPFLVGLAVFLVIWGSLRLHFPFRGGREACGGEAVYHLGRHFHFLYAFYLGTREYPKQQF